MCTPRFNNKSNCFCVRLVRRSTFWLCVTDSPHLGTMVTQFNSRPSSSTLPACRPRPFTSVVEVVDEMKLHLRQISTSFFIKTWCPGPGKKPHPAPLPFPRARAFKSFDPFKWNMTAASNMCTQARTAYLYL